MREVHCNLQIYRKYEVYVKLKVTILYIEKRDLILFLFYILKIIPQLCQTIKNVLEFRTMENTI